MELIIVRLVDPCPDQLFKCILVAMKEGLDRDYKLILQNSETYWQWNF